MDLHRPYTRVPGQQGGHMLLLLLPLVGQAPPLPGDDLETGSMETGSMAGRKPTHLGTGSLFF